MDTLSVFALDIAYNLVRAGLALIMFEWMLRYATARIAGALPPVVDAGGRSRPHRFADAYAVMMTSGIGLAVFVGAGMVARASIVVAVWK